MRRFPTTAVQRQLIEALDAILDSPGTVTVHVTSSGGIRVSMNTRDAVAIAEWMVCAVRQLNASEMAIAASIEPDVENNTQYCHSCAVSWHRCQAYRRDSGDPCCQACNHLDPRVHAIVPGQPATPSDDPWA